MPRSLAQKLIVSLTIIVVIIAAVSGLLNVRNQEKQLLAAMVVGADQLSRGIASATWHAMLADNRDAASGFVGAPEQKCQHAREHARLTMSSRNGRV